MKKEIKVAAVDDRPDALERMLAEDDEFSDLWYNTPPYMTDEEFYAQYGHLLPDLSSYKKKST